MTHYVCKGDCEAVSAAPALCQAQECRQRGQQMAACDCEDGEHEEPTS